MVDQLIDVIYSNSSAKTNETTSIKDNSQDDSSEDLQCDLQIIAENFVKYLPVCQLSSAFIRKFVSVYE